MSLAIATEDGIDRESSRSMPEKQVDHQPIKWKEYLERYEPMCPIFDPKQTQSVCFAEVCLAVCRARLPLDSLFYESDCKTIEKWRTQL